MGGNGDTPDVPTLNGGVRYTMAEAARIKGVSYHTVSRAVRSGKLPAQRLGRMALIAAQDLQAWRPMRERAPRKYRRNEPDEMLIETPVPAALDATSGHIDRLVVAGEQLLAVASAESTAGFGNWLARWLATSLRMSMVAIWNLDTPEQRGQLYGKFGPGHASPPQELDTTLTRSFGDLADQEVATLLDRQTFDRINESKWLDPAQLGTTVFVPLRSGSRCVGCAIVVGTDSQDLMSSEDLALAQRLGFHAAFAMEHVEMRETSRSQLLANESVLNSLPIQMLAIDRQGTFVYANNAFIDVWGQEFYRRYVGRHYSHLQRSYRLETFDGVEVRLEDHPITVALRGDHVEKAPYLVLKAPGETRAFTITAAPTHDEEGEQAGVIMTLSEVTEDYAATGEGERSPIEMLADARRRVELLASLSNELAQRRQSEDIFDLIAIRTSEVLEADYSVVVIPGARNTLEISAGHNVPADIVGRTASNYAFPMVILSMANRDIYVVGEDDVASGGRELMEKGGGRVALLVPLVDGDEALGVVALHYRDPNTLQRVDPELARAVGRQCGHVVKLHNVVGELEASRRRLLTTLDQLPQAVVIADEPEGRVVAMNRGAQDLWGASSDWLGQHISDIVVLDEHGHQLSPDRHPFLRPLTTRETELGVPLITREASGNLADVVANIAPVIGRGGDLRGAVAVLQRREHFKPIDQAKDEFISVVAHELRNPLTSLRGNLQMLERRLKRMETEDASREVDRVVGVIEQVDRIGDLVSRMLDVSRADLGKLSIAPSSTDAVQLVRGVIADVEAQLGDRRVNLEAPEELPVEWDGVRVQQVLLNLFSNAMRYAPEGDIDVAVQAMPDEQVAISMRDYGPGVPMRLRRRLFRLYYRFDDGEETADGLAMQQRGLGIGLYISARLATAHGGALSVDDAEGGGAVFTLTLPKIATPES